MNYTPQHAFHRKRKSVNKKNIGYNTYNVIHSTHQNTHNKLYSHDRTQLDSVVVLDWGVRNSPSICSWGISVGGREESSLKVKEFKGVL